MQSFNNAQKIIKLKYFQNRLIKRKMMNMKIKNLTSKMKLNN